MPLFKYKLFPLLFHPPHLDASLAPKSVQVGVFVAAAICAGAESTPKNNFALEESVNPSWVLFLPPDEYHELGLLMAKLILRKQNLKVYYFGSNLPFESITEINNEINPENVLYFILSKTPLKDLEEIISNVEEGFPNSNISVVCNSNQFTKFGKTQIINDVGQFVSLISE